MLSCGVNIVVVVCGIMAATSVTVAVRYNDDL